MTELFALASGVFLGALYGWIFWRPSDAHCAHRHLRGIYGDEINHTEGYRRLICRDCGQVLDGPVELAQRREEF